MQEPDWLADQFEHHRPRLRAVAIRMLGTAGDADDAVQEAWLRLSRSDVGAVRDLGRWLTTVVGRVCLDMLRAKRSRREDAWGATRAATGVSAPGVSAPDPSAPDPAEEAQLADSVGFALLVVLDTLQPAERLAFVLHDIVAVPYADVAVMLERSTAATKMLASRARARLRQAGGDPAADTARRHRVVGAFLAASRNGDFRQLVALLDRDVVFHADAAAQRAGAPADLVGAALVARQFSGRAKAARPASIDGLPGAVWLRRGVPAGAFTFAVADGRILAIELIADPERLGRCELAVADRAGDRSIGRPAGD